MSSTCETTTRPAVVGGPARVGVVVSGWPRISETFAVNELTALHRAGMLAGIYATKPGDPTLRHAAADALAPLVTHLAGDDAEAQAAELAARLDGTAVTMLHGYFAHRPAEVAAGAARRLGLPFGFGVHALDVRKVTAAELGARGREAAVVVACNEDAAAAVRRVGVRPRMVPHGVDLDRFVATPPPGAERTELLAVGRFVEKKGFGTLLAALALVERPVRLHLVGDGPLREELVAEVRRLGLGTRVEIAPRRTHATLPAAYAESDVVVVPSVVDRGGDRDGLPNVVLEAMACGRPVVATDVGAIASGVVDGDTGLLVPAGDAATLAAAITRLVDRPALRRRLGEQARSRVEQYFGLPACTAAFCDVMGGVRA